MKMNRIDRRQFLGWAGAAAGGVSMLACRTSEPKSTATSSGDSSREFAGQTLRLFIYSGFWEKTIREVFAPRFLAGTGASVIPDPGWWDSIPKLKASPPGQPAFDLVLTDATQGYPAIREGLFQKIDFKRISNLAKIPSSILNNWVYHEGYGIPFPDGAMTLAYNKKLLNFEPKDWGDLMRDDVKGKLGLYNSFYMSLYTFACLKVAVEGRPGGAAAECANNLSGVIQFARENRDRVKYWYTTSADMTLNLSQQNCALGNVSSGAMLSALRQRPDLGAIVPDADRAFVQLMWVIPVGARKELAEEAINLILSEEVQEAFARNGSSTALLSVAQKTAAADPLWGQVYPSTEEALKNLRYYPYDAYFKDWDHIVAAWDREILRKG
jgi:putative spermidine/putrescine transport system substrate-binding protein